MEIVSKDLIYTSRSESKWYLVPIGDIHLGNSSFDEDRFLSLLEWVKNEPRAVVMPMGDYADCINAKDARRNEYSISPLYRNPRTQYNQIEEWFSEIKDKIIGIIAGNHEWNFFDRHDIDFAKELAESLKVPYCEESAYVKLKMIRKSNTDKPESNLFEFYAHHGWTGARTDSYKVKVIQDLAQIFPGLPLYLYGHVHQIGEAPPGIQLWVDKSNNIRERTQRFVFTGSYLKAYEKGERGSYGARKGYKPNALGSPIIEISPNRVESDRADLSVPRFKIRVNLSPDYLDLD